MQAAETGNRPAPVVFSASTHAGEDAPVIAAAQELVDWLTIIVPRHPDRGDAIASLAGGAAIQPSRNTGTV